MKQFIFFCSVLFLFGNNLNAQQFPKLANSEDKNNDVLDKDWSDHEANAFKKRKSILKDTIVFDFNYKDELSNLLINGRSRPIWSKVKAVEMPNIKPSGNYPMVIVPIDTTSAYAARIYRY
ncbi:hypothetical protein MWU78_03160 [Arenibacter sp. F26102]|uniref:hypothetical protein n=1 Tax=Arenibacter sp. F26102 TaxID=2926416 RepID=UPI001FF13841|nr:hypothetical protein [Arenibacter sp. F26102]MCK0144642.1 hypothetical protein [Arenibacter sp. F26102]